MSITESIPDWSDYPEMRRVGNAETLWAHFGYWPKFHDAEIVRCAFETKPEWCYSIQVWIEAFEMLSETDDKGFYKLAKECLIQLEFLDVSESDFQWFSHQNVIATMSIQEKGEFLECIIDSSVGMQAEIVAREINVISLTPWAIESLDHFAD
jgi:hypothetical protein